MRNRALLALLSVAAFVAKADTQIFLDSVGAPLPGKQSALLLAFSEEHNITIVGGQPQCGPTFLCSFADQLAADFRKRGYGDVTTMVATSFNDLTPQPGRGYFTVDDFKNALSGANAGRYGVLISFGHAGGADAGIAVENYPSNTTDDDLLQRLRDLGLSGYTSAELVRFAPPSDPTEKVIAITRTFIANRAQLARNSFVFAYGCSTFQWFNRNNDNNVPAADVTFLDNGVGGIFFIGTSGVCPADNGIYFNYMERLLGNVDINGVKKNFRVREPLAAETSGLLLARNRNNDVSVDKLRLYNAPRILKGELKKDGSPFYQYAYVDQTFPFNRGVYPGDLSHAALRLVGPGDIKATLTFSQSMDPAWSGFSVQLAPQGGATPVNFVNSAWSHTNYDNDTWTGTAIIPAGGAGWDGTATVTVTARDASQLSTDPGGTLDNDGDGAADGTNRMIGFTIVRTPPRITAQSGQGTLPMYAVTSDNWITITAAHNPAPVATLNVFQDGNPYAVSAVSVNSDINVAQMFEPNHWYWLQACDTASNCSLDAFGIFPAGSTPPSPPAAPSAPPDSNQPPSPTPPQSPNFPAPRPQSPAPSCVASGVLLCPPVPPGGGGGLFAVPLLAYLVAGDPNSMSGPEGSVTPGQLMTYAIEFENVGEAPALGVYVKDVLDPALDDSGLVVRDMFTLGFTNGVPTSTTSASFPFSYDRQTRTLTVLAGNSDPRHGGSFIVEARLKSSAAPGTVILNQALIYFPNAERQVTPTNTIVSAVPLPAQLAYVGVSSGVFGDSAALAAQVSAGGVPITHQPISFSIAGSTITAFTNSAGLASSNAPLSMLPGNYALALSYPGDGFYYLPASASASFTVLKRATLLQAPSAAGRAPDTLRLALNLTDDRGRPLVRQTEEPKTVVLETISDAGAASQIASSLLSGTSVQFQFTMPRPYRLVQTLRARFTGDSVYLGTLSTGSLRLIDDTPPAVTILSPSPGQVFTGAGSVSVAFMVKDFEDPAPSASAVLVSPEGARQAVSNGAVVPVSSLSQGDWQLVVTGTDWAGNTSVALAAFKVIIDIQPPRTSLVLGNPSFGSSPIFVSSKTLLAFAVVDDLLTVGDGIGLGVRNTFYSIDGATFAVFASSFVMPAEGLHPLNWYSVDVVGNTEGVHSTQVAVDVTPPVSSLLIGLPQAVIASSSGPVVLVSSNTTLALAAIDLLSNNVASGVKDTFYRVSDVAPSTGPFQVFSASFTLSGLDLSKVIEFYSRDNVLNTEVVKSSAVLLDSTPPEIALLSPALCDSGICRVLKGAFPVLGTAKDAHLASYTLEFAPIQNATSGFILISSGTVAVSSSALGLWDTSKLSGWQTLRLTATDLVLNVASVNINVFVGDPAELMVLGNHGMFNMPQGVAVGQDGNIYVADTNNDRVEVFSSSGAFLASFGKSDEREEDHGDVAATTAALRLNKPRAVAVDALGRLYIADTHRNRVLELSPAGQVLLELGRTQRQNDAQGQKGERGERENRQKRDGFNKPSGVVVDGLGNIYVSDTENHRVRVFSSTGGVTLSFYLPPLPSEKGDDDEKSDKEDDHPELGKPYGIALDGAGDIYVADPKGRRALRFDPNGALSLTIPIVGQPFGIAASASGDCIVISDRKNSRILKFDLSGNPNLAFGSLGKIKDDRPLPKTIVFNKPMGLALGGDGNLYVADRNNERIEKFELPNGKTTLIVPPPKIQLDDDRRALDIVDRDDGGKVERKDLAAVLVPPKALPDDLKITVSTVQIHSLGEEDLKGKRMEDKGLKPAYAAVEYGPEGTTFDKAATIVLPYSADAVIAQGLSEDDLKVHYWNREKGEWQDLASNVDKMKHTVSAQTKHFSLYQVMGMAGGIRPQAAADPAFVLRDIYVFPNPALRGAKPTFHLAVGIADTVAITIYDISGREAHQAKLNAAPQVINDGSGAKYAYEYAWEGHIPSGVYLYSVKAEKSGYSPIRKSGKFAVVR